MKLSIDSIRDMKIPELESFLEELALTIVSTEDWMSSSKCTDVPRAERYLARLRRYRYAANTRYGILNRADNNKSKYHNYLIEELSKMVTPEEMVMCRENAKNKLAGKVKK
jgi:hypothetical protein